MVESTQETGELRWGILGTGKISSRFTSDLLLKLPSGPRHRIVAIGSSSIDKGSGFTKAHGIHQMCQVYDDYHAVYANNDVDIVYVGTPHALHKRNTLDALAAGKHVLCEKPLAMNGAEATEMIEAARAKGMFLMEGVWTRFFDLTKQLQRLLHEDRVIGRIQRVFVDFGLDQGLENLPKTSRLLDPALGAGVLMDIGVYTIMWGLLLFEREDASVRDAGLRLSKPLSAAEVSVVASSVMEAGIDISTSLIMSSKINACQAILTSTMLTKTGKTFARIEGSQGSITVQGQAASKPEQITIQLHGSEGISTQKFERPGNDLRYEADAVAAEIFQGSQECKLMALDESLAVMRLLDSIKRSM